MARNYLLPIILMVVVALVSAMAYASIKVTVTPKELRAGQPVTLIVYGNISGSTIGVKAVDNKGRVIFIDQYHVTTSPYTIVFGLPPSVEGSIKIYVALRGEKPVIMTASVTPSKANKRFRTLTQLPSTPTLLVTKTITVTKTLVENTYVETKPPKPMKTKKERENLGRLAPKPPKPPLPELDEAYRELVRHLRETREYTNDQIELLRNAINLYLHAIKSYRVNKVNEARVYAKLAILVLKAIDEIKDHHQPPPPPPPPKPP